MSWIEQRASFQKRFDDLSQENTQALITELNKSVGNYISKAGLSQDPNSNPDYNSIMDTMAKLDTIKQKYSELNDDIVKYITAQSKYNDLGDLLTQNGELQKQINRLNEIKNDMRVDVESAIARDELLRSRNTNITRHELFILDRPVRKGLIPYLWVISVLFIGVGLVIFKMTMPSLGLGTAVAANASVELSVMDFFSNKFVLISLLVSALIVIVFLSLKIAGVFGK
jgi:hypothetical protein